MNFFIFLLLFNLISCIIINKSFKSSNSIEILTRFCYNVKKDYNAEIM